jgi:hypothetical protein
VKSWGTKINEQVGGMRREPVRRKSQWAETNVDDDLLKVAKA